MVFKNSELETGVCYEYQGDKVSSAYLVDLLANGGQNGHCPEVTYPARCTFEGDNKSQVLMLFHAAKPVADAKSLCKGKKGAYTDASGTIRYGVPIFANAIYDVWFSNINESLCKEYSVENMAPEMLNAFLEEGFKPGNCPASALDVAVCYTTDFPKAGISFKNYIGGTSNVTSDDYVLKIRACGFVDNPNSTVIRL